MKQTQIALLSAMMVLGAVACKKKVDSAPPPPTNKAGDVAQECGLNLASRFKVTELKPVSTGDLDVTAPSVLPLAVDGKVVQFAVAFSAEQKDDANKDADFGRLKVTGTDGKILFAKDTGRWTEVVTIPSSYNQQTVQVSVAACVNPRRQVNGPCGEEKSIYYAVNLTASSSQVNQAGQAVAKNVALADLCAKLEDPAKALLKDIGYLKADGFENEAFDMSQIPTEDRMVIAAAANIYSQPKAFAASCAGGMVEQLSKMMQDMLSNNSKAGLGLADAGSEVSCGEKAKKVCQDKGEGYTFADGICHAKPIEVPVKPKAEDCAAKNLTWLESAQLCVQTVSIDKDACEKQGLSWDATASRCIQLQETVIESSGEVSLITESDDTRCLVLDATVSDATKRVATAACAKVPSQTFRALTIPDKGTVLRVAAVDDKKPASCLGVGNNNALTLVDADASGNCTAANTKFHLAAITQDGLQYSMIQLFSDRDKCISVTAGVPTVISNCTKDISTSLVRGKLFTVQPNGGGKPARALAEVSRAIRIRTELFDDGLYKGGEKARRCISAESNTVNANCDKSTANNIVLNPVTLAQNYFSLVGAQNKCLTAEGSSITYKECSSVIAGQRFSTEEFKADKEVFTLTLQGGSNLCLQVKTAEAPNRDNKDGLAATLELGTCVSGDFSKKKHQLFSKVSDTTTEFVDDPSKVSTSKKDIWTGSIIAAGAAMIVMSAVSPGLRNAVTSTAEFKLVGMGAGNAIMDQKAMRALETKFNDGNGVKFELMDLGTNAPAAAGAFKAGGQYQLVVKDSADTVLGKSDYFGHSLYNGIETRINAFDAQAGTINRATNLDIKVEVADAPNRVFGTDFSKGRLTTGLLGAAVIVFGVLLQKDKLGLGLADGNCDSARDAMERFKCKVRKVEVEAGKLSAQL